MWMVNGVKSFLQETWNQGKLLFFAEMFGTVFALLAAYIIAIFSGQYLMWVFCFYIISNMLFMYVSYIRRSAWMMLMMIGFIVSNIYGLAIL